MILVERMELTSGSSWHAAGGLFTVMRPNAVAEIHKFTSQIYRELEKELRDYEKPPIDSAVEEELQAYMANRKEQIANEHTH